MHVCVMIPTFQEKENLEILVPLLYSTVYPKRPHDRFSTLIVDDESTDGTQDLVKEFIKKYPSVFLCSGKKRGIGLAMQRGYRYVLDILIPDVIVTYEADFVFPPTEILKLLTEIDHADVVLASRQNVSDFYSLSWFRRIGHFVMNTVIAEWMAGHSCVHEHTAAGRAIRVKGILDQSDLEFLPRGYAFFPAHLFALARAGARFTEVPIIFSQRTRGSSKLKIRDSLRDLCDVLIAAIDFRSRN